MAWRLKIFWARFFHFIFMWPRSLWRFLLWSLWIRSPRGKHSIPRWFCGLIMLAIDLTPLPLVYSTIMDMLKRNTRRLKEDEVRIARIIFNQSIPLHLISLDPDALPVKRKQTAAYVSFYTINCHGALPSALLVHELVHVWQYEQYGSVYISEAIWAQCWGGGYNYGGLEPLKRYSEGKRLTAFNFEQQADIIEDYYRWKNGLPLQWAVNVPGIGEMLEKYKAELCMTGRQ